MKEAVDFKIRIMFLVFVDPYLPELVPPLLPQCLWIRLFLPVISPDTCFLVVVMWPRSCLFRGAQVWGNLLTASCKVPNPPPIILHFFPTSFSGCVLPPVPHSKHSLLMLTDEKSTKGCAGQLRPCRRCHLFRALEGNARVFPMSASDSRLADGISLCSLSLQCTAIEWRGR